MHQNVEKFYAVANGYIYTQRNRIIDYMGTQGQSKESFNM